jgi:hypothetical protein
MRLLTGLTIIAAFLLASTSARAQTSGVNNQSQRAQGCVAHLPLNANIKVTMKDGREIKGKLIAVRDSHFEIAHHSKTETIACAEVARVEKNRGFGRQLKAAVAVPVAIAGLVLALPGVMVAAAGAREAGIIIAAPGLALMVAACDLEGSECLGLALIFL